jgi:hypothetical protein
MISTACSAEDAGLRFMITGPKDWGKRFADILFVVNDDHFGFPAKAEPTPQYQWYYL